MATILPRQNRSGLIDSGDIDITGQIQQDTNYILSPIVTTTVRNDATLAIPVQLFLDGQLVVDTVWHFGIRDRNGNPVVPSLAYATGQALPSTVRGTLDLPRTVSIGLDLTLGSIIAAKPA